MKMLTAVNQALKALTLQPSDVGAMELARHQARAIDADPEALKKLGPHLLETLDRLGLTPKARAIVMRTGETPDDGSGDILDELRRRRERRAAGVVAASS